MSKVVGWIVGALATICCIAGWIVFARAFGHIPELSWLGYLFALLGWFPVFFIHELGHAVAALVVGWRVWVFHVSPFAYWPHSGAVRFVGDLGGPDVGGFVLALPRKVEFDTWGRSIEVSAGGPIASWLFAGACLLGSTLLNPYNFPIDDTRHYVGDPLRAGFQSTAIGFALLSVASALLTSWPSRRTRGNDAAHILRDWRERRSNRDTIRPADRRDRSRRRRRR